MEPIKQAGHSYRQVVPFQEKLQESHGASSDEVISSERHPLSVNLFEQVTRIYGYFATRHGATIAAQIGLDPSRSALDLTGMKASLGLEGDAVSLTHRELQARRRTIQQKLEDAGARLPEILPGPDEPSREG